MEAEYLVNRGKVAIRATHFRVAQSIAPVQIATTIDPEWAEGYGGAGRARTLSDGFPRTDGRRPDGNQNRLVRLRAIR